jgi:chemotaxis protein CheD
VAVVILHAKTKCVGMVHVALPDSSIDTTNKVRTKPGYFADTGIPALIKLMQSMGCNGPGRSGGLTVKIAGGANVMKCNDTFQIGKRNALAVKKILWSYGLAPLAEDIGGTISRTITVAVNTGEIILSQPAKGEWRL